MDYGEFVSAGLAAMAAAVLVHSHLTASDKGATLLDHIDIVLIAAAAMFLTVMVVQHPEWL